jgi:hypothetical protein
MEVHKSISPVTIKRKTGAIYGLETSVTDFAMVPKAERTPK